MFGSLFRNPIRLLVVAVALLVILSQSLAIVPEDKQALILRFGEIERTVNRYKPNEDFGRSGAGLVLRVPFTDGIQYIDKRILGINMERQQVLSTDQQRLQVDAFARFRITNPVRMYTAIRTEDKLQTQLATILGSSLRNELGKRTFATLLSPERDLDIVHHRAALGREQGGEGALAELVAQRRTEDRRELRLQFILGADRGVHAHRIGDAEARERVDLQPLLVGRQHLLALHVHAEDALVDILDPVGEGDAQDQPGARAAEILVRLVAVHRALDLAEAQDQRLLVLGHDRQRLRQDDEQRDDDDEQADRVPE